MSSGFHFRYPRARVHQVGGNWGITLSGRDFPEPVSFKSLAYAHKHAETLVAEMRAFQKGLGFIRQCPDGGRDTRPQKSDPKRWTGIVARVDGAGRCSSCYTKNRKGVTAAAPRAYKRQPDEPAVAPMTPAEVKAAMPARRGPRPVPLKPVPAPVVTDVVKEATAAYIPQATTPVGPHYLMPVDDEPACACGWDPYLEADTVSDRSSAVTAVRLHLRSVRTTS